MIALTALRHMRDGFIDAFVVELRKLKQEVQDGCVNDLVSYYRFRYIRHISGHTSPLEISEPFLVIADTYGLPGRAWLKTDQEQERDREERRFLLAVEQALFNTNLRVADRMRCEHLISLAFYTFPSERGKRYYDDTQKASASGENFGYLKASAEIIGKLARGEQLTWASTSAILVDTPSSSNKIVADRGSVALLEPLKLAKKLSEPNARR